MSVPGSDHLKSICFVHPGRSFLPDIQAYTDYFAGRYRVFEEHTTKNLSNYDILWFFMGWYRYCPQPNQYVVHEYSSLSIPPLARLKDIIKVATVAKPSLRVFQNHHQLASIKFGDKIPFVYRDMGVSDNFNSKNHHIKLYDLVYVGTMDRSRELHKPLDKLLFLKPDLRVLMIGPAHNYLVQRYKAYPNVQFCGVVAYADIPELLRKATFGLNYIPDKYPYNIQSSTKLLEYYSLGLPVIGNMTAWCKNFVAQYSVSYFNLDEMTCWPEYTIQTPNGQSLVSDGLRWRNRIRSAGFEKYLPSPF